MGVKVARDRLCGKYEHMTNPLSLVLTAAATAVALAGCSGSTAPAPEVADIDFGPVTFCDLILGGPEIDNWTSSMKDELAAVGSAASDDAPAETALDLAKKFAETAREEGPAFEAFFEAVADTVEDAEVSDELAHLSAEFMGPIYRVADAAENSDTFEELVAALEASDPSAWQGKTDFSILGDYEEATCS